MSLFVRKATLGELLGVIRSLLLPVYVRSILQAVTLTFGGYLMTFNRVYWESGAGALVATGSLLADVGIGVIVASVIIISRKLARALRERGIWQPWIAIIVGYVSAGLIFAPFSPFVLFGLPIPGENSFSTYVVVPFLVLLVAPFVMAVTASMLIASSRSFD